MTKPHEVLGVAASADEATIKAVFRRAAKECHPDLNGGNFRGEPRLSHLIAARDTLLDQRGKTQTLPFAF
jgi:curved DNA-binding protein CbpA